MLCMSGTDARIGEEGSSCSSLSLNRKYIYSVRGLCIRPVNLLVS